MSADVVSNRDDDENGILIGNVNPKPLEVGLP